MNMITDPDRLDLPSASSAARRRKCTGSENLIAELRQAGTLEVIPPGPDAESGTRVHAAWSGVPVELTSDEGQTVNDLRRLEMLLVADWSGSDDYQLLGREVRLWLHTGITPIFSGQYDAAYISADQTRILVLDAKTSFGDVESAPANDQLRELVALLHANYQKAIHFTAALLSPRKKEHTSLCTFSLREAEFALARLHLSLSESSDPLAPRTPGRWCDYCPARLQCPQLKAIVPATAALDTGDYLLPTGTAGSLFLEQIKTLKNLIKTFEEAYKTLLSQQPDALPGWHLRDGKRLREITQLQKALALWTENRLEMDDFLACTSLSISRLEAKFAQATGLRGRRLTETFNELLAPVLNYRSLAPELTKEEAK